MTDTGRRQPAVNEAPHTIPQDTAILATPRQSAVPKPSRVESKNPQRRLVHGHSGGADVSTHHRLQPFALFRNGTFAAEYPARTLPRQRFSAALAEQLRMTRARCGSLIHIRMTFPFTRPRRFSRRTGDGTMSFRAVLKLGVPALLALAAFATDEAAKTETLKGYVLDSACAITKGLKKPISAECATACAKSGSPLVLLVPNGTIYWPIANTMPSSGQNDKLLPFAGQQVTATGKVYHRGGSTAIVISKIELLSEAK